MNATEKKQLMFDVALETMEGARDHLRCDLQAVLDDPAGQDLIAHPIMCINESYRDDALPAIEQALQSHLEAALSEAAKASIRLLVLRVLDEMSDSKIIAEVAVDMVAERYGWKNPEDDDWTEAAE